MHRGKMVTSNIDYLAYALEGRMGSVLRLIRRDNSFRALLKGFVGRIMDVSFYHSRSNLLACLDQGGSLHIWDLDKAKSESTAQKLVHNIGRPVQCVVHGSVLVADLIAWGHSGNSMMV